MSVNSTAGATASSTPAPATNSLGAASAKDIQNEFLTLLVTQMKNQDPLNPMDSTQMTSQLAQISTVQGVQDLNTAIQSLMTQMSALQNLDTANLIGRAALVPGSDIQLGSGGAMAGYQLPSAVDGGTITIRDGSGSIVQQIALPSTAQGTSTFQWDGSTLTGGTAPAGHYTFSVSATAGGQPVTATALTVGQVQGVSVSGGASSLDLGTLGQKNLSDIVELM